MRTEWICEVIETPSGEQINKICPVVRCMDCMYWVEGAAKIGVGKCRLSGRGKFCGEHCYHGKRIMHE